MNPTIEPRPSDAIRRRIFGVHSWPLMGAGDVATHEAAHLVVGRALGMPCHDARITPDGTAGQAGVLGSVGKTVATPDTLPAPEKVAEVYRLAALVLYPGLSPAEGALNFAAMLVAGRQAELIRAGIRLDGELRMHDADHKWARAVLEAGGRRLAMTWAQRQARHLLTSRWAEVETIAEALRKTGTWTSSTQ